MSVEHVLTVTGLCAGVDGAEILRGVDLEVRSGRVHALMGPNGSGKSTLAHVVAGRPGYEVTAGSMTLDGADLSAMPPWERAHAGLFLAMQHPTEVPGVSLADALSLGVGSRPGTGAAAAAPGSEEIAERLRAEAAVVGLRADLLDRSLNVDLSGGERKRAETCQLAVVEPAIAILDELDSGLDVDALRSCAQRIEQMTEEGLGVLAITHFSRVLRYLRPDEVHVIVDGRIVDVGGPELVDELEADGYARYMPEPPEPEGVEVRIGGAGSLEEELGL
ncbi:MAG TPA: Fe-S cluster assembly ATPase SufC [Acidimicrobiaceae bacterium]|nr:Fe-S cluster assembly ATPase SufC [Acidimicrobiaceae bacterium]